MVDFDKDHVFDLRPLSFEDFPLLGCFDCGAIIIDPARHKIWHDKNSHIPVFASAGGVTPAILKIEVPVPHGTFRPPLGRLRRINPKESK